MVSEKIYFVYICVKVWPCNVASSYLGDHCLNKVESIVPKDASTQVSAFLAKWFISGRILKNTIKVLSFIKFFYLEKGMVLHFNELKSNLPNDASCKVKLKLTQLFSRSPKYQKFTNRRTPDKKRSEKLSWAFCLGELKRQCSHF